MSGFVIAVDGPGRVRQGRPSRRARWARSMACRCWTSGPALPRGGRRPVGQRAGEIPGRGGRRSAPCRARWTARPGRIRPCWHARGRARRPTAWRPIRAMLRPPCATSSATSPPSRAARSSTGAHIGTVICKPEAAGQALRGWPRPKARADRRYLQPARPGRRGDGQPMTRTSWPTSPAATPATPAAPNSPMRPAADAVLLDTSEMTIPKRPPMRPAASSSRRRAARWETIPR